MKVDEYFKYGLKQKYYRYKSWILGCFSIVTEDVSIKLKQQASRRYTRYYSSNYQG